ncbi:hypothetical protein ALC56_03616, partial [Trachymyrmex septentrionalis]
LDQLMYTHFLFLHAVIRILVFVSPSKAHLSFANLALQKFVERCQDLYSPIFYSYNVHGLIHLTNDVQLGPLDTFSAFIYKNNMNIFRKFCRKTRSLPSAIFKFIMDLNCFQYRKIKFSGILFTLNMRDNCCTLHDMFVCLLINIIMIENSYYLILKTFLEVKNFYDVGMYEVCSKSIANFEFPRVTYIRFSIFLWRYVGTHVSHLCRQVRPF